MKFLRQSTAATVVVGPFLAVADAVSPVTDRTASSTLHGRAVMNGTGAGYTPASFAHDANGYYLAALAAGDVPGVGRLRLEFSDPATFFPVWEDFTVLSAAVYDQMFGTTASVDVATIGGKPASMINGTLASATAATITFAADDPNLASVVPNRQITLYDQATHVPQATTIGAFATGQTWNILTPLAAHSGTYDYSLGDIAPAGGGTATDPWSIALPGSYAGGSAGAILGQNLDARVSTRSTFAGGAVASVTAPVTIGTVADKSGYSLAPAGLDQVMVESGVNARQALSIHGAYAGGNLSGADHTTPNNSILINGLNNGPLRISAATDQDGNRTVTLHLPS